MGINQEQRAAMVRVMEKHALRQRSHQVSALAIMLERLDDIESDINAGKCSLRAGIVQGFNDRLRDALLKSVGESIATDQEMLA